MPKIQHNKPSLLKRRRSLRKKSTPFEINLWNSLKNNQLRNCKFRRQHSINNYILDFYCAKKKLAIEIDGDSHFIGDGKEKDKIRDELLRSLGIKVLRFVNCDVGGNLNGVLEVIYRELED